MLTLAKSKHQKAMAPDPNALLRLREVRHDLVCTNQKLHLDECAQRLWQVFMDNNFSDLARQLWWAYLSWALKQLRIRKATHRWLCRRQLRKSSKRRIEWEGSFKSDMRWRTIERRLTRAHQRNKPDYLPARGMRGRPRRAFLPSDLSIVCRR